MSFINFILVVVLIVWVASLRDRVNKLEKRNENPQQQTHIPPAQKPAQSTTNPTPESAHHVDELEHQSFIPHQPPAQMQNMQQQYAPKVQTENPIAVWFKENTLIKIGGIFFFLGAVWFVSYAVSQGWISPTARIFIGLLLGIGILVIGHLRRAAHLTQYLTLTTLGTGVIIASIFAAQFVFFLFAPPFALLLLLIAIAYAVFVSIKTQTEWLAVLSAINGLIAPLLINQTDPDATLFFTYLLFLSIAFLIVIFKTQWRFVTFALSVGVLIFQLQYYAESGTNETILWAFVLIFGAVFYGATTVSLLRSKLPFQVDIATLTINLAALLAWTIALANNDGLTTLLFALITALTGYILHILGVHKKIIAIYAALSIVFLLTATALLFDGSVETILYTLEVSFIIALATYLRMPQSAIDKVALLFVIPVISSVNSMTSRAWDTGAFHSDAFTLYILGAASLFLGGFIILLGRQHTLPYFQKLAGWFVAIGYLYLCEILYLTWFALLEPSGYSSGSLAHIPVYISWAVVAYIFVTIFTISKLPLSWVHMVLVSFGGAVILSLQSFDPGLWKNSINHPDAVGLYLFTILMGIITIRLWRTYHERLDEVLSAILIFSSLIGMYLALLVWRISHALASTEDTAVTISLIIYTITGLACYSIGKSRELKYLKITGIILLVSVIARVGLVDIWKMEVFWRIVTFIGIGALFIITALLEKSPKNKLTPEQNIPEDSTDARTDSV